MTISGSVDFTMTRNQLIKYAYVYVGAVDAANTPPDTLMQVGNFTLNTIVHN